MIHAYIDDSGSDDRNAHFVLGAVFAGTETWKEFDRAWSTNLRAWNLRYFKMSEAHGLRGEFSGWDRARRDSCVGSFLGHITARPIFRHAVVATKVEVREAFAGHQAYDRCPSAYPMLFHVLMFVMASDMTVIRSFLPHHQSIRCFFDNQDGVVRAVEDLRRVFDDYEGAEVSFGSSKEYVPLQAADMFAWSVRRHQEFGLTGRPTRIYTALAGDDEGNISIIDKSMLSMQGLEGT